MGLKIWLPFFMRLKNVQAGETRAVGLRCVALPFLDKHHHDFIMGGSPFV
jgi:hypothetical protein